MKNVVKNVVDELRFSVVITLLLLVLCCGVYPLVVWAIGQGLSSDKANGSLVIVDGKVMGSTLLAQGFSGAAYFHPRPSAAGQGYDAANSSGTNLGPTSKKLIDSVRQRVADYRGENGLPENAPVPADTATASASGLDPHISVDNARLQAGRVAKARGVPKEEILRRIVVHTEARSLMILGEPRVNVLMVNLSLDGKM